MVYVFFNDTATTEIYTLSLHDALPIYFMWPLIVLSDDRRWTLPVALANLSGEHVQDTELMMAGSVLTVLPVMLVFLFLQRFYIAGITAGGVKGGGLGRFTPARPPGIGSVACGGRVRVPGVGGSLKKNNNF